MNYSPECERCECDHEVNADGTCPCCDYQRIPVAAYRAARRANEVA